MKRNKNFPKWQNNNLFVILMKFEKFQKLKEDNMMILDSTTYQMVIFMIQMDIISTKMVMMNLEDFMSMIIAMFQVKEIKIC